MKLFQKPNIRLVTSTKQIDLATIEKQLENEKLGHLQKIRVMNEIRKSLSKK